MKDKDFDELMESIKEAGDIKKGTKKATRIHEFPEPDVKAIRNLVGFSQSQFAALLRVNIRTLQNWEQGHRHPTGPARVLLRLVEADPESVFKTLHVQSA